MLDEVVGRLVSYRKERHPITPIIVGRYIVFVRDCSRISEEDESVEGEDGADELEDGFDMPFRVMLLQATASLGGEDRPHCCIGYGRRKRKPARSIEDQRSFLARRRGRMAKLPRRRGQNIPASSYLEV